MESELEPGATAVAARAGSPAARSGLLPASAALGEAKGRGSATNPASRFERLRYEADLEALEVDRVAAESADEGTSGEAAGHRLETLYLRDPSRSALARNSSPDLDFDASLNPYRGCEHACAYCYARPTHEYLGFSAGLDFETRILVKEQLPALLRKELSAKSWKPQVIAVSGVTDAYQPIERKLEITRACLSVLLEFRNPVAIITKSALVARDADLLRELASFDAAAVNLSITTLDPKLARSLEPRASQPIQRLRAIEALAEAGVPVGVMVSPVIPGLNDHEVPAILSAAKDAGAQWAGTIVLRLPHGVKELFSDWLERHAPLRKDRVLARVRELRSGRLSDPRFGTRMRGEGEYAEQMRRFFELSRRRIGLDSATAPLSAAHFKKPGGTQMALFG